MDELIQAMSIPELHDFKARYPDNGSLLTIIDGHIKIKTREEVQGKAREAFGKAIGKLVDKLPHPDDVHNVFLRWVEVEVEDTSQEPEEVTIHEVDGIEAHVETRYPRSKVWQWEAEFNKGFQVGKATNSQPSSNKRAITLYKRNGLQNELVGNFTSASKACEHIRVPIGGDSAPRVLAREGYIVDAYTGIEFLS